MPHSNILKTFPHTLSAVKGVFQIQCLSYLVSSVGSPRDSDGAFVACLNNALAGLHTEALLLQRCHVIPHKLTTLEESRYLGQNEINSFFLFYVFSFIIINTYTVYIL